MMKHSKVYVGHFGKYEVEDFINHPLSKFTSDIFEQISELDLHKK